MLAESGIIEAKGALVELKGSEQITVNSEQWVKIDLKHVCRIQV